MVTRPRILHVDDDDTTRFTVRHFLESRGYQVKETDDGNVALALMDEYNPDLILLDMQMPRMDGATFIKKMQEKGTHTHVPIILISGMMGLPDVYLANMDMIQVVHKPFTLEQLYGWIMGHCSPM